MAENGPKIIAPTSTSFYESTNLSGSVQNPSTLPSKMVLGKDAKPTKNKKKTWSVRYKASVTGPGTLVITDKSLINGINSGIRITIDGFVVHELWSNTSTASQRHHTRGAKKNKKQKVVTHKTTRELQARTYPIVIEHWRLVGDKRKADGWNPIRKSTLDIVITFTKAVRTQSSIDQNWDVVRQSVYHNSRLGHPTLGRLEPARFFPVDNKGNPQLIGSTYSLFLCQINPSKYSIQKNAKWKFNGAQTLTNAGNYVHNYQTNKVEPAQLTINELWFDTTEDRDTNGKCANVYKKFVIPLSKYAESASIVAGSGAISSPPRMAFMWGPVLFIGYIKSFTAKYTLFDKDGTPLRALVTMTMQEARMRQAYPRQNPSSGAGPHARVWRVTRGDRLDTIAAEVYGDANEWRKIADLNEITDPLAVQPGQSLLLPS